MKGVLLGLYFVAYSAFTLLGSDGEQYSYKRQNTHVVAYTESLCFNAIKYSKLNMLETQWYILKMIFKQVAHCLHYISWVATTEYSPCGQIQDNKGYSSRTWTVITHPGTNVNFTFVAFRMNDAVFACEHGSLTVECDVTSEQQVTVYCGVKYTWDYFCHSSRSQLLYNIPLNLPASVKHSQVHVKYQTLEGIQRKRNTIHWKLPHLEMDDVMKAERYYGPVWGLPLHIQGVSGNIHRITTHTVVSVVTTRISVGRRSGQFEQCGQINIWGDPGRNSPQLLPKMEPNGVDLEYKSSSFVAVIIATVSNIACTPDKLRIIVFLYDSINTRKVKKVDLTTQEPGKNKFTFTNLNASTEHFYLDVMIFEARHAFINVTVLELNAFGPTSYDCRHWGLMIFHTAGLNAWKVPHKDLLANSVNKILEPMFILCKTTLGRQGVAFPIPRDFISNDGSIVAVWYSHNTQHSLFSLTAMITHTECPGVYINCMSTNRFAVGTGKVFVHRYDTHARYFRRSIPVIVQARAFPQECSNLVKIVTADMLLCLGNHSDKVMTNVVVLSADTECATIQQIYYYPRANVGDKASDDKNICRIDTVTRHLKQTDISVHSVNVQSSHCGFGHEPPQAPDRSGNNRIQFNPSCSAFSMHVRKLSDSTAKCHVSNYTKCQPLYPTQEHYSRQLQHTIANDGFVHFFHSFQFGDFIWFNGKPIKHITMANFSATIPNITVISATTKPGCKKVCAKLRFIYDSPVDLHKDAQRKIGSGDFTQTFHKHRHICVSDNLTTKAVEFSLYLRRYVDMMVKSAPENQSCQMKLSFDPFYPINQLIPSTYKYVRSPCCDKQMVYHYVFWKAMSMSWFDAYYKCNEVGGNLPLAASHEELSLLEHIILGTRFNSGEIPHISPIRFYPYSGVFLGFNVQKVRTI